MTEPCRLPQPVPRAIIIVISEYQNLTCLYQDSQKQCHTVLHRYGPYLYHMVHIATQAVPP